MIRQKVLLKINWVISGSYREKLTKKNIVILKEV